MTARGPAQGDDLADVLTAEPTDAATHTDGDVPHAHGQPESPCEKHGVDRRRQEQDEDDDRCQLHHAGHDVAFDLKPAAATCEKCLVEHETRGREAGGEGEQRQRER